MKYLVLLVVLVVAFGIWRSRRARDDSHSRPTPPPLGLPQDMLACARCGTHVPTSDAQMLGNDAYCSVEHRQLGPA